MSSRERSPAAPDATDEQATCTRQKPYSIHQVRSMLGKLCRRPATDKDKDGKDICAVHRGADVRGAQNRQRAKERYYLRLGINPETGKSTKITD